MKFYEKKPSEKPKVNKSEGSETEAFVISNSNGNGINPSPVESGNSAVWSEGKEQSERYVKDSTTKD